MSNECTTASMTVLNNGLLYRSENNFWGYVFLSPDLIGM